MIWAEPIWRGQRLTAVLGAGPIWGGGQRQNLGGGQLPAPCPMLARALSTRATNIKFKYVLCIVEWQKMWRKMNSKELWSTSMAHLHVYRSSICSLADGPVYDSMVYRRIEIHFNGTYTTYVIELRILF